MVIQLVHCTGLGAYAVIDKRCKGEDDAQASSSDDVVTLQLILMMLQMLMYPGFSKVKMRSRGGMPVAFADFAVVSEGWKPTVRENEADDGGRKSLVVGISVERRRQGKTDGDDGRRLMKTVEREDGLVVMKFLAVEWFLTLSESVGLREKGGSTLF
ncbi:hypothetical protein K1719_023318 [Acacia pycnantha]|nr:hypothetical protein K1719_023318 [Acacia pycnantha]